MHMAAHCRCQAGPPAPGAHTCIGAHRLLDCGVPGASCRLPAFIAVGSSCTSTLHGHACAKCLADEGDLLSKELSPPNIATDAAPLCPGERPEILLSAGRAKCPLPTRRDRAWARWHFREEMAQPPVAGLARPGATLRPQSPYNSFSFELKSWAAKHFDRPLRAHITAALLSVCETVEELHIDMRHGGNSTTAVAGRAAGCIARQPAAADPGGQVS